jgi:hypothetical protein
VGKRVNYDRKPIIAAVGCNLKMRYILHTYQSPIIIVPLDR